MTEQLQVFMEQARWFGAKGRSFRVTGTRRLRLPGVADAETTAPLGLVTIELVTIEFADSATDLYQVPVSYYLGRRDTLSHALIGEWEDDELGQVWAYDALHDHAATPLWLEAFRTGKVEGDLSFVTVGDPAIDTHARSTLMTAEQSNSSVAFGEDSVMKVFRRLTPGVNPDIEILRALTEGGNEHIAALYGYVETTSEGEPLQLGILQQFLRTASDGWDLALASLRNLFGDGATHARDAGGDFAAEAHRLGVAVAEMHESLAAAFPTEEWDRDELADLADAMSARLDRAVGDVPEIEPHAPALHSLFDAVRHLGRQVTVQRVHGDLHLGQTLRTVRNWKIIDFEGEPAKPLPERRRPDSRWRDVAGMVRSFDYAAELSRTDHEQATGDADANDAERAREWAQRNIQAFVRGYREAAQAEMDELDEVMLTAYAADKAVYEAVYEARNRPGWLPIPLGALARIADQA